MADRLQLIRIAIVAVAAVGLAVLPYAAGAMGEGFLVYQVTRMLIYALAAVSLDLLVGYGGMVSLGHAAFFGLGAYITAILSFHAGDGSALMSWPLAIEGSNSALWNWGLSMLIAAAAALGIGAVCLRTTGIHFIMITLAFAQMLFFFFVSLEKYGGDDGLGFYGRNTLPGIDMSSDTAFYYVCLALLAAFLFISHRMVRSRFGMVIRGARQNERRMHALGFPVFRYKLTMFVIAALGAGLAGGLMANHSEFVSPELLHWSLSGQLLVMVILGGMGSLFGPVLGAFVFLVLEDVLVAYTEYWMVYFGPFLVLMVLFSRGGLWGFLRREGGE
ncbi:MAG TPA: branched-chain amino acid ABC transporter permease [Arenicellales bacterium]|nr:branched-chain amino acid ABC transporter permease [Arenicellales bacterium]